MSSVTIKPIAIPAEIEAEMTPAVRAFVAALIGRIAKLEARLALTPQNSSLPPSSQHPHAKPPREKKKGRKRKRGGQPGHRRRRSSPCPAASAFTPSRPVNGCAHTSLAQDRRLVVVTK